LPEQDELRDKRRKDTILGVAATKELLHKIDEEVELSKGKYETRSDLVRDAVDRHMRHLKEARLRPPREHDSKSVSEEVELPSERDKAYEKEVKTALSIIEQSEDSDIPILDILEVGVEDITDEAKEKRLIGKTAVWSDERVQKAMRKRLQDLVYPKSFWDETRKFRKAEAKKWITGLRKYLKIPPSVAENLVLEPTLQGLESYEEEQE